MTTPPTWHGTDAEEAALLSVLSRNCGCQESEGATIYICAAHRMVGEQRALDGLICNRRRAAELREQEMTA